MKGYIIFFVSLAIFIISVFIWAWIEDRKDAKIRKELSYLNFKKYFHKKQGDNFDLYIYNNHEEGYRKVEGELLKKVTRILKRT